MLIWKNVKEKSPLEAKDKKLTKQEIIKQKSYDDISYGVLGHHKLKEVGRVGKRNYGTDAWQVFCYDEGKEAGLQGQKQQIKTVVFYINGYALKKGPPLALFIQMLMEMAGLKTVDVNNAQFYCFRDSRKAREDNVPDEKFATQNEKGVFVVN